MRGECGRGREDGRGRPGGLNSGSCVRLHSVEHCTFPSSSRIPPSPGSGCKYIVAASYTVGSVVHSQTGDPASRRASRSRGRRTVPRSWWIGSMMAFGQPRWGRSPLRSLVFGLLAALLQLFSSHRTQLEVSFGLLDETHRVTLVSQHAELSRSNPLSHYPLPREADQSSSRRRPTRPKTKPTPPARPSEGPKRRPPRKLQVREAPAVEPEDNPEEAGRIAVRTRRGGPRGTGPKDRAP